MNDKLYTVSNVASILSGKKSKDNAKLIRQLRYWTQEGIINPVSGKGGGTGVHRKYNANSIRRAALALEYMKYGMNVSNSKDVDIWSGLLDMYEDHKAWHIASEGKVDVLISHTKGKGDLHDHGYNQMIIIDKENNDVKFLDPIRFNSELDNKTHDYHASSLMINLTKLFAQYRL